MFEIALRNRRPNLRPRHDINGLHGPIWRVFDIEERAIRFAAPQGFALPTLQNLLRLLCAGSGHSVDRRLNGFAGRFGNHVALRGKNVSDIHLGPGSAVQTDPKGSTYKGMAGK